MKLIKFSSLFLISILLFTACSNESETDSNDWISDEQELDSSKIEIVETLFDKDIFDDPIKKELLKELQICDSDENNSGKDYNNPSCSPRFFEIFPLSEKGNLKNSFILQIKARTNGFPLRRLLIFERENGALVKVNGFVANLIEKRITPSGYNDIVLRFNDKDQGMDVFYNCLFKWTGKKYEYHSVEVIEGPGWGGPVKQELKDSVSKEVLKDITKNQMIF